MSDQIDEAQDLDAKITQAALERARTPKMRELPPGFDGSTCTDCGELIELLRRHAGRSRCIECQEYHERDERVRRKTRGEE